MIHVGGGGSRGIAPRILELGISRQEGAPLHAPVALPPGKFVAMKRNWAGTFLCCFSTTVYENTSLANNQPTNHITNQSPN